MKLITWNCNMAYRKKAEFILVHEPDIVIVPECECPDKLKFPSSIKQPTDVIWHGDNLNKGLGVFSYSDYRFKLLEVHNPEIKTILPIAVSGGEIDFTLFAIWANNPADRDNQYIGQVWKALEYYKQTIDDKSIILIGDFNSNTIWDKKHRLGNHSTVVEKLSAKNITSLYHHYLNQTQGKELHPTFSLYRHKDKPYHIDYCFASADLLEKLDNVSVGSYEDWHHLSDHKPLMIQFNCRPNLPGF